MDYQDAVAWLYGRQRLGIKLGLDKVQRLLAMVDDPQNGLHIIHIAGTNGKGTVATLLAAALRAAGHKTGLYTSPHLTRFTERIDLDGAEIGQDDVARLVARLQGPTAELDAAGTPPTFFELVTAMALLAFHDAGMEWAVIETGLGGRLDATNVVDPELTIITSISVDHSAMLGLDEHAIAGEKAGIMKPGVPCVTNARGAPLGVLKARSHAVGAPMSIIGTDYLVHPGDGGFRLVGPAGESAYRLAAAGSHQAENAALVVAACEALRSLGHDIPSGAVQRALAETQVPGRLETVHADLGPWGGGDVEVLLDGAHNADAAHALRRHLADIDLFGFDLIIGIAQDKHWQEMLHQWVPLARRVHAVPLRSARTLDPDAMRSLVEGTGIPFLAHADVDRALRAVAEAGGTQLVVAGSFWVVGEARALLRGESLEEIRGTQ